MLRPSPSRRYFFAHKRLALGSPLESRCREIVARNSVMDGVPNARGRLRASGKPLIGLSSILSTSSLLSTSAMLLHPNLTWRTGSRSGLINKDRTTMIAHF
jgi:hypothetical protein